MSITNKQLHILTNVVYKEISAKKAEFVKSDKAKKLAVKTVGAARFKRMKALLEEKELLKDKLAKLTQEMKEINDSLLSEYDKIEAPIKRCYRESIPVKCADKFEEWIINNLMKISIDEMFPLKGDVESAVVLASMEGGEDLLTAIRAKLKLK